MKSSVALNRYLVLTSIYFIASLYASDPPDVIRKAIDEAVVKVKPALVQIMVVDQNFSEGRTQKSQSAGSGAIITADGYVITNHHVAGHAVRLLCILSNKEEIPAELIGTDALSDIAVVRLKPEKPREFPFVTFADSSQVKVGDWVLAMGSPMALSQSVTFGVVSNTEMIGSRLNRGREFQLDGENVGSIVKWIGHDAAIYGGNSGGPLVNLKGDIVGINEIGMGLGGAIPANLAKQVATQLMQQGRVRRASLGFLVQNPLKSTGTEMGVLINSVLKDSPAEKAGFQVGDLLIAVAGQEIHAKYAEELPLFNQLLMNLEIGTPVAMVVKRGQETLTLQAIPEERENMYVEQVEFKEWGMTASNLSKWQIQFLKRASRDGVYVATTRAGGPCGEAKPSVEPGDILVSLNGIPIKNLLELQSWTANFLQGKKEPEPVVVIFDRGNQQYLSVVKVGIKELKDPGLEVRKAWLPIKNQVLTRDMAKLLGIPDQKGVRVTYIYPKSSAEESGLQVGDLILKMDGEPIPAENPEDVNVFPNMIRQYKIGDTVELLVRRGNEEKNISVKLIRSPRLAREMKKAQEDVFEFTVREVAYFDKTDITESPEEELQGVIVEEVKPSGWAALGGLLGNDIIVAIHQEKITDLESFKKKMKQLHEERPQTVIFQVSRGSFSRFIELEPDWNQK